ncbi:MAG: tetratricopeptide repeat protein [Blastocatellia bacterium]|nr:tetratricopeptide repeat protein [Blastocatellia bacterium]
MSRPLQTFQERLVFTSLSGNNLPKRNDFFTGRENILNKLYEVFSINENNAVIQVLRGFNGTGKTHTALEFCYLNITKYQNIFWINAKNEVTFSNSYYDIARLLGLITTGSVNNFNSRRNISLVNNWLSTHSDWLLVYDQLEDMALLPEYLPANYQGHILITTKCQDLANYSYVINLAPLSVDEATLFLLKRANLIAKDEKSLESISDKNKFPAQQIIQEVNALPLALSLIAAYIEQTKCSLTDYLTLYQNIKYFPGKLTDISGEELDIDNIINAIYKLTIDQINKKNLAATELLQCCSILSFEKIPEEIFIESAHLLSDILSDSFNNFFIYNESLSLLLNYSLIERDNIDNSISLHSLLKTSIVNSMNYNTKVSLVESLTKSLNYLVLKDPQGSQFTFLHQRILSSALALSEFIISMKFNCLEVATLFYQLGIYCQKQMLLDSSLDCYFLALTSYRSTFGDNHSCVAVTLNNIGEVYRSQENYYLALNCYLQSLECYKESFSDNHPSVAMTLANLGILCAETAREMEAVDYYKRAIAVFDLSLANDHPWVIKTIRMYSNLLFQLNRNEEAQTLLNRINV